MTTKYFVDFDGLDLSLYQMRKRPWPKWFDFNEETEFDTMDNATKKVTMLVKELNIRADSYLRQVTGKKLFKHTEVPETLENGTLFFKCYDQDSLDKVGGITINACEMDED